MKRALLLCVLFLSFGVFGCNKIFVGYCDRVAKGTADKNWVLDATTYTVPFSKASYRSPEPGKAGAICVTAQGDSAESAAGKNFMFEIADANDRVLVKKKGSSTPQRINRENEVKLWGGKSATNKNTHESTECFPVAKIEPFVKVKVKRLSTNETDESKIWSAAAYCKRS